MQCLSSQRFAQHQYIGHHIVMLTSEHAAGFAQAGRDFVENQQCSVIVAGAPYLGPETWRRDIRDGAIGFRDNGCYVAFAFKNIAHQFGADPAALVAMRFAPGMGIAEWIAIAAEGRNMFGARQQWADGARTKQLLAPYADSAKSSTVKGIPK